MPFIGIGKYAASITTPLHLRLRQYTPQSSALCIPDHLQLCPMLSLHVHRAPSHVIMKRETGFTHSSASAWAQGGREVGRTGNPQN